ncbi:HAMP domain-containing histidine kinase [Arsenicicoccus piscis]|uniref:histidine kinase n=1 Tax=Arsenicicoccus piscis TaxID=673954 RepID=A0ABQ6HNP5_9MICO|nr:HAMP domain-containing sensor histidine kinase [Arsenicicoccus piscis]MCH8628412.1 HAMP domain-containing histidine kinase [Arsenicicoccus piscis]GMA20031.1 hypothetical protein GCM10025862_20520 [Arsenicicoccus piscis]
MWAATQLPEGYVLAIHQDWTSGSSQLDDLDQYLVVGVLSVAAVTVLLAIGTGVALSRRPGRAELTARRIADGELGLRVSDAVRGRDGVASLGAAIDHLASSMQDRLASEQRVTGYIAHDLRTPVTSLVTASSLLPDDRAGNLVRSQATRLWRLIEDLLEVDSAEQQVDLVPTSTPALARAAVEAASQPVRLTVEESADVTTDPRRVQRALVNLLENAIRHGGAEVECVVRGRAILVQDDGDGFPPVLLEHGPRRFVTGSPSRGGGNGLGLTIAAGQAGAIGATLQLANRAQPRGAVATLTLPA